MKQQIERPAVTSRENKTMLRMQKRKNEQIMVSKDSRQIRRGNKTFCTQGKRNKRV